MFDKLNVFQIAMAAAQHAGARQALVAQNVANADTPGYVAKDLMPFAAFVQKASNPRSAQQLQKATRPGHLNGANASDLSRAHLEDTTMISPNGNSVSVEDQMLQAVDLRRQHDRSMAIYKSSLTILRTSLGRK